MKTDILITTFNRNMARMELAGRSLESLLDCTPRDQFRLTILVDGSNHPKLFSQADHRIMHKENEGLGPSINQGLSYINALKKWDPVSEWSPLLVYVQDDVIYTKGWLEKLSQMFLRLREPLKLGFASGIECPEHPVRQHLGNGMVTKDWIRATCMLSDMEYWMSMWPISRIDPETGRERGRPHDGLGSSVDWWFIRDHKNSVCQTGRTNLVIPGLLQHAGYKDSTWLKKELPESESDKRIVDGQRT